MDLLSMCYFGKWDIVEQDIANLREFYHGGRVLYSLGFGDDHRRVHEGMRAAARVQFSTIARLDPEAAFNLRYRLARMEARAARPIPGGRSSERVDYWHGRHFNYDLDPSHYEGTLNRFEDMCRRYGFRISFDGGDQFGSGQNTDRFADFMRERLDTNLYLTESSCNEGWQTGSDPRKSARWLERTQSPLLKVLTSPAEDDVESMREWSIDPADMRASHPAFGNDVGCGRRAFNVGYEGIDNGLKHITFFDENRGCDRNVSVHRICNPKHLQGLCAAEMIGHGIPAWMGHVIRDGTSHGNFDGGTPYQDVSGFREWSEMLGYFSQHAKDIFSWPVVCHGGTRWAGTQWFRTIDPEARFDQTIAADGRAFCIGHSGRGEQVRGVVEDVIELDEFTLYRGHV